MTTSGSPSLTTSPAATTISLTTPATSASTGISIFIDSRMTTGVVGGHLLTELDLDLHDGGDQLGDDGMAHGAIVGFAPAAGFA